MDSTTHLAQNDISVPIKFHGAPVVIVRAILSIHRLCYGSRISFLLSFLCVDTIVCRKSFFMGRMIIRQMRINSFKDDFINNITHELRTPLTILKSSIDALRALVFQQILRNLTDI
ncbi:hypothetical protein FEF09_30000 [Chitinophaga pinensis]|uniref:histidine kinase n=2 Tax=Chitinophaga pinensis TaxID=79329 RepID=A0A5C6LKB1_9BACT|nr:hypothetical protein FEF09_30000 [Chitinophaga pinensis]